MIGASKVLKQRTIAYPILCAGAAPAVTIPLNGTCDHPYYLLAPKLKRGLHMRASS